ncbi:hypothetical protein [Streptomyces melanosporofaciens]|uniref:hypothetical protein n=1 Tax=Streptomyces melanosporofaciens TaxID=67327 RepID=UPI000B880C01|nr:hypothetical protein [Streptomyces melanosporofaciens]
MEAIDGGRVVVGDDDLQAVQMFGCHLEQGGVHLAQPFQVDAFVADVAADAVNDQKVGQRVAIVIERHLLVGQGMGHIDEDFNALGLEVAEGSPVDHRL